MEIDLKADIKKFEVEVVNLQGQLVQAQQRTQLLSNHVVMRQGIIAYLQALDGKEEGAKMLKDIIGKPDLPPEIPPPPAEPAT